MPWHVLLFIIFCIPTSRGPEMLVTFSAPARVSYCDVGKWVTLLDNEALDCLIQLAAHIQSWILSLLAGLPSLETSGQVSKPSRSPSLSLGHESAARDLPDI
jgi:hypothetical protein